MFSKRGVDLSQRFDVCHGLVEVSRGFIADGRLSRSHHPTNNSGEEDLGTALNIIHERLMISLDLFALGYKMCGRCGKLCGREDRKTAFDSRTGQVCTSSLLLPRKRRLARSQTYHVNLNESLYALYTNKLVYLQTTQMFSVVMNDTKDCIDVSEGQTNFTFEYALSKISMPIRS